MGAHIRKPGMTCTNQLHSTDKCNRLVAPQQLSCLRPGDALCSGLAVALAAEPHGELGRRLHKVPSDVRDRVLQGGRNCGARLKTL